MDEIELTVLYDNYPLVEDLRTAHGFSCLIWTSDGAVLFDTGGSGRILLDNVKELGLDPSGIGAVVLSHMHWDHIGGLDAVLAANPDVPVYAPSAFSSTFLRDLRERAHAVVETERARQVTGCAWTTAVLERPLVEQALFVETAEGIVVVTGCAHPGVVELARAAVRASGSKAHAVLGGFHMTGMGRAEIARTIDRLKDLDVARVGPCHCSGDPARRAMREAFGEGYIEVGVGARLRFPPRGTA